MSTFRFRSISVREVKVQVRSLCSYVACGSLYHHSKAGAWPEPDDVIRDYFDQYKVAYPNPSLPAQRLPTGTFYAAPLVNLFGRVRDIIQKWPYGLTEAELAQRWKKYLDEVVSGKYTRRSLLYRDATVCAPKLVRNWVEKWNKHGAKSISMAKDEVSGLNDRITGTD
jgi:hypothetical protein